jgi:hypothetical protein
VWHRHFAIFGRLHSCAMCLVVCDTCCEEGAPRVWRMPAAPDVGVELSTAVWVLPADLGLLALSAAPTGGSPIRCTVHGCVPVYCFLGSTVIWVLSRIRQQKPWSVSEPLLWYQLRYAAGTMSRYGV